MLPPQRYIASCSPATLHIYFGKWAPIFKMSGGAKIAEAPRWYAGIPKTNPGFWYMDYRMSDGRKPHHTTTFKFNDTSGRRRQFI
jgi:hypothetical protein